MQCSARGQGLASMPDSVLQLSPEQARDHALRLDTAQRVTPCMFDTMTPGHLPVCGAHDASPNRCTISPSNGNQRAIGGVDRIRHRRGSCGRQPHYTLRDVTSPQRAGKCACFYLAKQIRSQGLKSILRADTAVQNLQGSGRQQHRTAAGAEQGTCEVGRRAIVAGLRVHGDPAPGGNNTTGGSARCRQQPQLRVSHRRCVPRYAVAGQRCAAYRA